jgi:hypothetical protein
MTTTHTIRFLASAATFLALHVTAPASAAEIPMVVGQPVRELPAATPTRSTIGTAEWSLRQETASMAPATAASDTPTDAYCSPAQGELKSKK